MRNRRINGYLMSNSPDGYLSEVPQGINAQDIINALTRPDKRIALPFQISFTKETQTVVIASVAALTIGMIAIAASNSKSKS